MSSEKDAKLREHIKRIMRDARAVRDSADLLLGEMWELWIKVAPRCKHGFIVCDAYPECSVCVIEARQAREKP